MRKLNDKQLFQRLLDGKAVQDEDGDRYWLGADGNLVYCDAESAIVEPNYEAFGRMHSWAHIHPQHGIDPSARPQAFYAARKPRGTK